MSSSTIEQTCAHSNWLDECNECVATAALVAADPSFEARLFECVMQADCGSDALDEIGHLLRGKGFIVP